MQHPPRAKLKGGKGLSTGENGIWETKKLEVGLFCAQTIEYISFKDSKTAVNQTLIVLVLLAREGYKVSVQTG